MPPLTLSLYLSRQFLKWLGIALAICCTVGLIGDLGETSRIAAKGDNADIADVITLTLLRFPNLVQEFMPFIFLFGSIGFFSRLNRTQELIIARASGLSVWQFLTPSLLLSALIGILMIAVWNPFAALMSSEAKLLEKNIVYGDTKQLSVSDNGLWLREDVTHKNGKTEGAYVIIYAPNIISSDPVILRNVSYLTFSQNGRLLERLDARIASLKGTHWVLEDIWATYPDGTTATRKKIGRITELNSKQIQENFVHPKTISFWQLPRFINLAENSGFPTEKYEIHLHSLRATPLLLCAMVLIAAVFGMNFSRMGGSGRLILLSIISGLLLFFITDFMQTLGTIGLLPPILSAWAASIIASFFGLTLLLYQEDG